MCWLLGEEEAEVAAAARGGCGARSIRLEDDNDADRLASSNMRLCLSCVYWMLLLVSVVSSTLLFLLVASENTQGNKFIGPDRHQSATHDGNTSVNDDPLGQFELGSTPRPKIPLPLKPKLREQNFESPLSASFDGAHKNEESKVPEEIEILKESLIQQPNLSQGISEGGQAVVLTLVDTAAGLQSLATDRADFRPKQQQQSAEGNASAQPDGLSSRLSHQQQLLDANNSVDSNETLFDDEDDVVVVRAEQKAFKLDDDVADVKSESLVEDGDDGGSNVPTTAPDLNDSAARARLTGDDGSAAAILDGLVTAGPGSSEPHEEIPSFNEWAQKRLEEAEKKKTHPNASVQTANGSPGRGLGNMRMRSKNYASPDCGAKIVAANPESSGVRNILVSTRDEYMLNACTNRVWFVVELCEAIQAKKIELANFELFSSSPKDISVHVSDRFPTREWSNVGHFTARDERDVQSFSLQPQLFGKFIKVELQSHYGSEHFCPISLFRAYGTSEFEVLETETEHGDEQRGADNAEGSDADGNGIASEDDDDEPLFSEGDERAIDQPSHIFGSARDAVLSIVKKATQVLAKSEDLKPTNNITKIQESIRGDVLEDETLDDCTTPIYNVACHDCDDDRFARVFQLISCKGHYLESLLNTDFVLETLAKSRLCSSSSGFDFRFDDEACVDSHRALETRPSEASNYYLQARFLSSFFTPDYVIALCNVLAAREQRLFANTSHQDRQKQPGTDEAPTGGSEQGVQVPLPTKDDKVTSTRHVEAPTADGHKAKAEVPVIKSKLDGATEIVSESLIVQIKPTKTTSLNVDDSKKQVVGGGGVTNLESSKSHPADDVPSESPATPVASVTKRPSSASHKASSRSSSPPSSSSSQDHVQPPAAPATATPQDQQQQREVPKPSKVAQSVDSSQNSAENEAKVEPKSDEASKETEAKAKTESVEQQQQDAKAVPTQDQLSFENFDFDVEGLQQANGASKSDAAVAQQTAAATPQQKESVFLRLSNRIKVLERNMSLSSQYLEELSRRYKRQVEEMQRSLERAVTAMTEESRKGEERESKRVEEVAALRSQIESLTRALDDLVYERNSWRLNFSSLAQHSLFVLVDVVVVIFILWYCKRADDDDYYDVSVDEVDGAVARPRTVNKTYEAVKQNCKQLSKKAKKRRPSEIASQVTGTYDQLMIEDGVQQLSKKDRRKRRKRETLVTKSSSIKEAGDQESKMPSRSASVSDALYTLCHSNTNGNYKPKQHNRTDSAPDSTITYFRDDQSLQQQQQQPLHDKRVQILAMDVSNDDSVRTDDECSNRDVNTSFSLDDDAFEPTDSSPSSFRFKPKKLSSPSFMKTALGARSKRISLSGGPKKEKQSLDDSNLPEQGITNGRTTNGLTEESDESRASSATPSSWHKKEKKTNGLKKMVRRFF